MSSTDHEHVDYVDQRYFDDLEAEVGRLRRALHAQTLRMDELDRRLAELEGATRPDYPEPIASDGYDRADG
jgi:predicted RNase H-like nuclease (RuvC/YqgF family)